MNDTRPHLTPGADHPISLEPSGTHVTVRVGPVVVAESDAALEMREASYPPVLYVPIGDVDQSVLSTSDEHSYCPYKGDASYYDVTSGEDATLPASVWFYAEPYPAVADIAGHVAFYADRFVIESRPTDR
jgi:uncharacterized protein (DUF427 family)